MKRAILLQMLALTIGLMMMTGNVWGQTTVFSDDFSTNQSATWTTSGQIGSSAFYVSRSGADWGARRNTSPAQLELTNDVGATGNVLGWVFAYASTANFSTPYNTTLSSNPGLVTWFLNIRQIRTDPAGYASGNYGAAFILAATSTTAFNAGTGYAIVYGQSGSTDPIRLAKFSGGLSTGLTNIITSNTTGLTDFGAEYISCKVTYNPSNNQWELFLRNDGESAFADPMTGTLTTQGTATDNTYTSTALAYMGGYWQGSTGATQTAFFDNLTVRVTSSSTPLITLAPATLSGFTYVVGNGPSEEKTFTVSGENLTADVSIAETTNYEISKTTGAGYTTPLIFTPAELATAKTVYVRLKKDLAVGTYNGETIVASSTGATNKTVTCSGSVYQQIDWANLQHPANGNINLGNEFIVYAQVYEPDVTDATGQGAGITCWIGYSTENTNPSGWTNWVAATYHGDAGNNDEYKADIGAVITPAGTYYYASRFQLGTAPYVYGGYSASKGGGFWDGSTFVSGVLTVDPPPQIDWCNLQSPANGGIYVGGTFNVYAQVYEPGVTNSVGQGAGINAWIGYNTSDTDPSTWSNWILASYNTDAGNNDEYMANIGTSLPAGTYYYASRFKYGLADYVYGGYSSGGGNFWDGSTYVSGVLNVTYAEPSNHVSNFIATTNSSSAITVSWDHNNGTQPATNYLILAKKGAGTFATVADGSFVSDDSNWSDNNAAINVAHNGQASQSYQWTGLTSGTTYDFIIYPYNGSGISVNYKTNGDVPQASSETEETPSYIVDFEGDNEIKTAYASGTVNLSGLNWDLTETLIGTLSNDFKNGVRSARLRGYGTSAMTMLESKNNGIGRITFHYRRYGTDTQVDWKVEYSLNNGSSWTQVGNVFTAPASADVQTFNELVNMAGNVRIRIKRATELGSVDARLNIDDIAVSDYKGITTWNGSVSNVWTLSTNWSNGVPAAVNNAVIASSSNNPEISAGTFSVNSLTINTGATLTVSSDGRLTVNGTLTNNATATGLVIKSGATGTGSLIHSTANVPATVERYLAKYNVITDHMFHFLSSPVEAQAIREEFVTNIPTAGHDFYSWDEVNFVWVNSKTAGGLWNTSFENNFIVGKGYLVAYPTDVTKNFTGELNTYPPGSPLVLNCTNTTGMGDGWNLLGNPFPSALDWNLVSLGDGIDNALYYYDASEQNYRYYLQLGEIGSLGGGSRYIPAMQGFMVHAKTTGTKSVRIDNSDRVHTGQDVYYKSAGSIPGSLSLKVSSNGFEDETFIHFTNGATPQFDGSFDAYKLASYSTQVPKLYTMSSNGYKLAINGLPEFSGNIEIPVYFESGAAGQQILTADLTQMTTPALLVDLKTGTIHSLSLNPEYSFMYELGDAPNRFLLKFGTVGVPETPPAIPLHVYVYNNMLNVVNPAVKAQIEVYNVQGQLVINREIGTGLQSLPVGVAPGTYLVRMITEQATKTAKVVIQ